jgi:hypothetical protein
MLSNFTETTLEQPIEKPFVCEAPNKMQKPETWASNLKYLIVGTLFGIVFVKAEIISWFRIQEMFRLQSFFMYGVIGSAVLVGMISVFLIKKFNIKTLSGETVEFHPKKFQKGQIYGGLTFGLGCHGGLSGAAVCPDWQRLLGRYRHPAECRGGNLDVWLFQRQTTQLNALI